ncbi:MAG TPA: saccharopine dehydrogenase NADP-binding domain-containing protein, partial [Bacteroidota bacterium]|nr:saccharopine dehydrogenase NADP-binding domain-containing protein [Bacteroidota bacterium]
MKFLVLGSGLMGKALALDLTRSEDVSRVTLADADGARLEAVSRELHSHKLQTRTLDVQK